MPVTYDGSVFTPEGAMKFCSVERFVRDICKGNCCFVCGRPEREIAFNREHILPNWVLHRFNLHGETVTLPNGEQHRYGTYTLPCCVECNAGMSRIFETPISAAVAAGYAGVEGFIRDGGGPLLFQWMALIFLKYHLKDRHLRAHLDRRRGDAPISAKYEWEHFHHIHSIARAHHTGAILGPHVIGSMIVMQRGEDSDGDRFDACTATDASTIYLQLGETMLFAVLNDGQASVAGIGQMLDRIDAPISPPQAREVAAELAAAKLHLENPPAFSSDMSDHDGSDLTIRGAVEAGGPRFLPRDDDTVGYVKCALLQHYFAHVAGMDAAIVEARMRANQFTFLWDGEGRLIRDGARPAD